MIKPIYNEQEGVVYSGDCLDVLKQLPEKSVNLCLTSCPYWRKRDYGVPETEWEEVTFSMFHPSFSVTIPAEKCCLGLEESPLSYISHLVLIFRQIWRVLKDDAAVFLNIGDSYIYGSIGKQGKTGALSNRKISKVRNTRSFIKPPGMKNKDLAGIPWAVAFALRSDGWFLRQDIVWEKLNPLPDSAQDRCANVHEYIFLLGKSKRYYFDNNIIREPLKPSTLTTFGTIRGKSGGGELVRAANFHRGVNVRKPRLNHDGSISGAAKRSVWRIANRSFSGAHYATFPPDLVRPCVLAGCPEDGVILDPFFGTGTTGVVAAEYDRRFIGIDLSEKYLRELAIPRIRKAVKQGKLFTHSGKSLIS